jgi:hypothetical protein
MDSITIRKIDDVYLQIVCEKSIAQELSDYFKFKTPDLQFNPLYKAKLWDGMIRLFDLRNNCIFVGLYHYIEKFCKDREYLITADSWKPIANEMSAIEAKNYIESLNIHSKNKPIKAHDYQIVSFIYAVRDKRLLLESPTSSGK